jgi:DNA primase
MPGAAQTVIDAARNRPKTTGAVAIVGGLLALVWGGGEYAFRGLEWIHQANESHELAVVAQSVGQENEKRIQEMLDIQREKTRRAEIRAEEKRNLREEIARMCRAREITNREKCIDAGAPLPD